MKLQAAGVTSCVAMKVVVPADHHAGVAASVSLYPYRSISYHHRAKMIASIMPIRWSASKLSKTTLAYSSSKCKHQVNPNSSTASTTITIDNPGFSVSDDDELLVDGAGERITSSEHEEEEDEEEEEYWINELGRGGMADLVERLECLEEEALSMGEDNDDDGEGRGREATDYNRRAMIFDKCSQVFQAQALKNRTATTATTTSSK